MEIYDQALVKRERIKAILDLIQDEVGMHGRPPTVREIQEHLGYKSPSSVQALIRYMVRDGLIEIVPGARGISISRSNMVEGEGHHG